MKTIALIFLLSASALVGQTNSGELHLKVTDPSGIGVKAAVQLTSEANQYSNSLTTNNNGRLVVQNLPYGIYRLEVRRPGFAVASSSVEIRSPIPLVDTVHLKLSPISQTVEVNAANTLIDPYQAGSVSRIGRNFIQHRISSIPGRSIQDLVNSQPGWLYEGNAVLHPRGSEYQTQFVLDGVPLTDNRSPSFGPELEANDIQSMSIYTAGIPAEYGRKMGGVVELNTMQDWQPGFHGETVLSGGSFDTAGAFAQGQYVWGKNTVGVNASGDMTGHYLNPVVPENYTNTGTLGDFSSRYERDLTPKSRLNVTLWHDFSRYELPNEQIQETPHPDPLDPSLPLGSQLQNANNLETMGIVSFQHIFSKNVIADFHAMVRNNANHFWSNLYSTPIEVFQHNRFNEGYFKGAIDNSHGRHEIKAGVESDNKFLHEDFRYLITDDTRFDPSTPANFSFAARRPDLEQAAFVQDQIRFGNWNVNAGVRWDHYQLLVNRQATSPRVAISRYFPSAGLMLHASYDHIFDTPSFENILLSSSTAATTLDTISLQLPVEPSIGNYVEAGATKAFFKKFRINGSYFERFFNNFADDDQLDNTTISFPIAFRKAIIYGADGKLEFPESYGFSGFLSYSYEVGNAWFPVTGGLFLGDNAELPVSGHFPNTQDQRNTVRGRIRYRISPRLWVAGGIQYNSGLPFEFQGTIDEALAQYGQQVVNRVDFAAGRIRPSFLVDASLGVDIYKSDRMAMRFQVDGENLTNVLDVIDFGGLFSGNAIGPSRSFAMRLTTTF